MAKFTIPPGTQPRFCKGCRAVQSRPTINPDPPGPLATRKGELVATDYHAIEPASRPSSRQWDPWQWAGFVLVGGFIPLLITGLIFQLPSPELPPAPPSPEPVTIEPASPDSGPSLPILGVLIGVGALWLLSRSRRDEGHPDCPNHCPAHAPCRCGHRVRVTVDFDRD